MYVLPQGNGLFTLFHKEIPVYVRDTQGNGGEIPVYVHTEGNGGKIPIKTIVYVRPQGNGGKIPVYVRPPGNGGKMQRF